MRTTELADVQVPVIGQGTWRMGEDRHQRKAEVSGLREGVEQGMWLIDTAEMYGEGGAEEVVGEAIAGMRDRVFLVSKVYPHNASRKGVAEACERSLKRMGTDIIDLYLLHWCGQYPLAETVAGFEALREQGKIRRWGVSNFDVDDLEELNEPACATNQVLYNLQTRGIEYDLLPWQQKRKLPLMAYSPLGQGGDLLRDPTLERIAERHGATPAQIALAWLLRQPEVIAIPKAAKPEHIRSNVEAAEIELASEDLELIDSAFPPPTGKQSLGMI